MFYFTYRLSNTWWQSRQESLTENKRVGMLIRWLNWLINKWWSVMMPLGDPHVCMYIRARTHTGTAVKVPCWELTQPQLKKAHTHVHMHVFLALVHVHADCWTYDSLCVHISVYVCVCGICRFNWIFFPSFYCCVLCCKSAVLSKNVLNDFAQ